MGVFFTILSQELLLLAMMVFLIQHSAKFKRYPDVVAETTNKPKRIYITPIIFMLLWLGMVMGISMALLQGVVKGPSNIPYLIALAFFASQWPFFTERRPKALGKYEWSLAGGYAALGLYLSFHILGLWRVVETAGLG